MNKLKLFRLVLFICAVTLLSSCDKSTEPTPTEAKQGISGTVRSTATALAISDAKIYLTIVDSIEVFVDSTVTSGSGTYKFDNLKPGHYVVYCFHDEYHDEQSDAVVTANTNTTVNFSLDFANPPKVRFHVRDVLTKQPIFGAEISGGNSTITTNKYGNAVYDGNYNGGVTFKTTANGYLSDTRTLFDVGDKGIIDDTVELSDPKDFLVASYYFSNNLIDSTGNGHDGTNHGVAWTADRFGNPSSAIYCDGTTDYVSVEDAPKLNFGKTDFTICVWVNTSGSQSSSNTCFVVDKSTLVSNVFTGYQVAFVTGPNTQSRFGTTYGSTYIQESEIGGDNLWHLYTVVVKRSGTMSVYYDGKLQYTDDTGNDDLAGNINTTAKLLFGGNGTAKNAFKGKIDDIKLYNVALDEKFILDVYHENGW